MPVALADLPPLAVEMAGHLRAAGADVFGDDLVALWLHGGTTFADRPAVPGDLDACLVLRGLTTDEREPSSWKADPSSRPQRLMTSLAETSASTGIHVDLTVVVERDLEPGARPANGFHRARPNSDWAILRAHLAAGQFVTLLGPAPADLGIEAPTDDDLHYALDRELEHLERHVVEGDAADPYEATYAVWNCCRILRTVATGDAVCSKRTAGDWGLANLDERWRPAIEAAGRSYDGQATDDDRALLEATMPAIVEYARSQLAPFRPRPAGHVPRWS